MSTISNTRLIISILQQIPRHPANISINELREKLLQAEGLDIPIRNMQRYLSQVKGHFGLDCEEVEAGKANRWFVENVERRSANRSVMPSAQAISYVMANQMLEGIAPSSILRQLEPAFKQALASLSSANKGYATWDKKVKVVPDSLPMIKQPVSQGIIDTAVDCILRETQLEIIYTPRGATNPKKYKISPLGMVVKGPKQYLVCMDESSSKKTPKHFLLNRVQDCSDTHDSIDKNLLTGDKAFDLERYCQRGQLDILYDQEPITLIAEVKPRVWKTIQDNPISEDQKLAPKTDGDTENMILSATVANNYELKRWILSYSHHITVLEPQVLREKIQENSVNAASNYQGSNEDNMKRHA